MISILKLQLKEQEGRKLQYEEELNKEQIEKERQEALAAQPKYDDIQRQRRNIRY